MSRPKGSKNRSKDTWLDQKEKTQPTAPSVEKQKRRAKPKEIDSTTTLPNNEEPILSGEVGVETAGVRVIKGFVNIQKNTMNPKRVSYYTGADIHDTVELAKSAATKNTVATVYMAFEVKV